MIKEFGLIQKEKNKNFNKYLQRHNSLNFDRIIKISHRNNISNNNYLTRNKISKQFNKNNAKKIAPNNKQVKNIKYNTGNNSMSRIKNSNVNNTLNDIYKTINKINKLNSKIKNILSHNSKNDNDIENTKEDYVKKNNYSAQNTINNNYKINFNFKNPNFFNRIKKLSNNNININNKTPYNNYFTEDNNNFLNVKKISGKISKESINKLRIIPNQRIDFLKGKENAKENNYLSDYESSMTQSSFLSDYKESIENSINLNYNKPLNRHIYNKTNDSSLALKLLNKEQNNLKIILNKIEKSHLKSKNFINSKNPKRYKNIKDILLLEKYKQIELQRLENINNVKRTFENLNLNEDDSFKNKIKNLKYNYINTGENYYNLNTKNNYNMNKYFKLDEKNKVNNKDSYTNININENNNLFNHKNNYDFNMEIEELDDLII